MISKYLIKNLLSTYTFYNIRKRGFPLLLIGIVSLLLTTAGCSLIWNTDEKESVEYAVGSHGPAGGFIFYDDEADGIDDIPDIRYLEAAPRGWFAGAEDSTGAYSGTSDPYFEWGAFGYEVGSSATGTGLGAGQANTSAIVMFHRQQVGYDTNPSAWSPANDGTVAARICDDAVIGEYDDWFLPSQDELNLMNDNLKTQGIGGMSSSIYWSSTELNFQNSYIGIAKSYYNEWYQSKSFLGRVRPIRAF